ncbi:YncE family protein [Pseudomonas fluorescens]|uniref:YncE family protein n=1 Tax=Pseudomonas fluorescens TaxID=294 RepID=UPI00177B1E16|nr:YncE family protein [Pseudomonas fluorescens]MBD8235398.1 YncE family protein [Pseudomonas fluorescens]MDY0894168.1 YncE family protein [Pseudomonas fluorescens]
MNQDIDPALLLVKTPATPSSSQSDDLRREGFTLPQPDDALLTPASFASVPFSDLPLYLPTLSNPVVGYDGGLNRAALDVAAIGVICILLPYLGQSEGDFIELRLNNIRVDFHTVTDDEAANSKQIILFAPSGAFLREAGNTLQAFVTRIGGGTEETKRFNLLVDSELPGGRNPTASTPENENLPLPRFPQSIIDFGVDKDNAGSPIEVLIDFYPANRALPAVNHRKVRDRILLSIGGVIVEHRVTEFEASGQDPIKVFVNPGIWPQVGSGVHVCEYNVVDEVGNASDGFSPAQVIEVRLDDSTEPFLPAAFIFESEDDGHGNDVLNYDELNGINAKITVPVRGMGYLFNDTIRVRVIGLTQGGVRITNFYNFTVTSTTVLFANIEWPNADIQPLVGGRIQITYKRLRTGVLPRNSESTLINIIGTPIDTSLPAPLVPDAIGGVLPPTINPVFVHILAYPGQAPQDRITLLLEGDYANGDPYYDERTESAGNGDIYFELPNGPNGDIAQLEGGRLRLSYKVNGAAERPQSKSLALDVGDFQASLPAPVPRQALPPHYVFDPDTQRGDLNVTVTRHAAFVLGATVTLHFEGSAAGGSAPPNELSINSNWFGRDLPFTIPRVYVIANLNGTGRLYYTVEVPGQRTLFSFEVVITVGAALNLSVPLVLEGTVITPTLTRLNPEHVLPPRPEVVTVRVSYSPMLPSDQIKVRIIGAAGFGTPDIPSKPGIPEPGENYVSFTVSNLFVGANLGMNCQVFYEVIRDHASTPSKELTLQVQDLPAQELDLVRIPEAVGGQVETHKAYTVRVDGWPFMRLGQAVWIDLLSSSNYALRISLPVSNEEFNARRISMPIPANYLRSLHEGDTLEVQVLASLDGTGNKSSARPLEISPPYRVKRASGVVEGAIAVGNTPNHLALSSDNSTLYVANFGSKTVSVIDTATRKVTRTISLATAPRGIAIHPSGQTLYVTVETSSILAIETENFQTIKTIAGFNYCSAMCLNPTGSSLYVGSGHHHITQEIKTSTYTTVRYLSSDYYTANAVTTNRSGSRVYTTGNYVNEFNQSTGTLLGRYHNGSTASYGLAYSPTEEILYVTTYGSTPTNGSLNILSTTTTPPSLIKKFENLPQPWGIAFTPNGDKAYMCLHADNSIKIIDTATRLITGEVNTTTHPLDRPKEIVISSDGAVAYVANSGNNNVIIVSL